jgi:nitroreductase
MQFDDVIQKRASYRTYNNKEVAWEDLTAVLNAARMAPSSGNLQNWSFVIVKNQEAKQELSNAAMNQAWISQAPLLIVVCSRNENIKRHYGEKGEKLYAVQNCAAAINNILLKATDIGLASCWINAFDEQAIKRILKIPESVSPQAIVSIGYSDDKTEKLKRYDLDLLVHFEVWEGKQSEGLFPLKKHEIDVKGSVNSFGEKGKGFFSKIFGKKKEKNSTTIEESVQENPTSASSESTSAPMDLQ